VTVDIEEEFAQVTKNEKVEEKLVVVAKAHMVKINCRHFMKPRGSLITSQLDVARSG